MRVRPSRVLLGVLSLVVVGCKTPAGGQWPGGGVSPRDARPATAAVEATSGPFLFNAVPERERYVLGEPIYVALKLRNDGRSTEPFTASLRPEAGAVEIEITGPDRKARTFVPLGESDHGGAEITLEPGEAIGKIAPVFFGARGWTFTEPGRYTLRARLRTTLKGRVSLIASPPASVEIVEDEVGRKLLGHRDTVTQAGKILLWQAGDHLTAGREALTQLIARSPDTVLASYAHFALGRSWSDAFMDYGKREVRPPDCERALKHLAQVRSERVTPFVQVQTAMAAARCHARTGNLKGLRQQLDIANTITAEKPEFRALRRRAGELESLTQKPTRPRAP